jgi:hypothetical protein
MTPRRAGLVGVVALAAAVAVVVVVRWDGGPDSRVAAAVALAPAGSERLTWTDWAAVRDELDTEVGADAPAAEMEEFLDKGFEADLTPMSALVDSAPALHASYGVSPANLDWELLAQGPEGQLILMGLPESVALDDLRSTLDELGYTPPEDEGGIWHADAQALAAIGTVTPELANLRIDAEERVLAAADEGAYLDGWDDDRRGTGRDDGIDDVVAAYDDDTPALAAAIYSGDQVCSALAMSQADDADQAQARQLLDEAGEIHPVRGFTMAALADGTVEAVLAFETEEQARTDADTRAALAAGPAPGQGGSFADRFAVDRVTADDRLVTLSLEPVDGAYVLSDLTSGPVLFATC